jgi:hypothetical protein
MHNGVPHIGVGNGEYTITPYSGLELYHQALRYGKKML